MSLRDRPGAALASVPVRTKSARQWVEQVATAFGVAAYVALSTAATAGYFYNLYVALQRSESGWFVFGMMVPPIGVLRGVLLWLGWA